MKINWPVCLIILFVSIIWQSHLILMGCGRTVSFITSFLVCMVLSVALEAVKRK